MTVALRAANVAAAIGTSLVVVGRRENRITVKNTPRKVVASPYIEKTLEKIKRECGAKLICHPDYVPTPRHSNNPEIYVPARAEFLASIAAAAQRDRENNPAYIRAKQWRELISQGEIA